MAVRFLVGFLLCVAVVGCGSDEPFDPNESETTRAIREKVKADMERDRLASIGRRLEGVVPAGSYGTPLLTNVDKDAVEVVKAVATGDVIYELNCASCHGIAGLGDGPVGQSLNPKPANFTDGGYMNALSNEHVLTVIAKGGAAVGKSALMAPWAGTLSDEEIRVVAGHVRSLAQPAFEGELP